MATFWQHETDPERLRQLADELSRDGLLRMAQEYRDRAAWLERQRACPFCGAVGTIGWFQQEANASCETLGCLGQKVDEAK